MKAKDDLAIAVIDALPVTAQQQEPQHGGSYIRDPNAGTITRTQPAPADQPVQE